VEDSHSPDFLEKFYLDAGFATRAIHAGEHVGQPQHASHTGAIYQTSTFVFGNAAEAAAVFSGEQPGYAYTRLGKAKREKGGITDGLVRLSVGVENVEDLIQALDDGLKAA